MGSISFILHGKIGGKKKLLAKLEAVFSSVYHYQTYETKKAGQAIELAKEAVEAGCDYLISIGGDGTLNEVINGYMQCSEERRNATKMGMLPWGTGNDFSRSIGVSRSVEQLKELIDNNQTKRIDIGHLHFTGDSVYPDRYFDNIADLGMGAEVVSRVNGVHLRKNIFGGTLVFFFTALRTFFQYRHKSLSVSWDGFNWEGKVLSVVIANGQYFGSGLGIAPDAKLDDGKFQVVIFGKVSVVDYLKNYGRIRRSEYVDHPEIFYLASDEVFVDNPNLDAIVESDGEVCGKGSLVISCKPGQISFLCPPS